MLTKPKKNLFIIWLFGIISGFTLMISGNTLNYWLAKDHIDLKSIGIFAFISIPYAINFIWAPVFDTKKLMFLDRWLGHRLSWVCFIQVLLAFVIFILSKIQPSESIFLFAIIALIVSFLSSAQDTVLGAFRTEIVAKELQGSISGIYIFGYRLGMLISGSLAIYLSSYISFQKIYEIFAILVLTCPLILICNIKNLESDSTLPPETNQKIQCFTNSNNFIKTILNPVGTWKFIILVIIFLILYRLPDNFINVMLNPFFIHLGYNEFEIATFGKLFGIISAIIGSLIASFIMKKKKIIDSLLIFGILHAIAHSMLIAQEIYGKALWLLCLSNAFESITGGMVMSAYIAFIASLCEGKFRATQYSFFSSMMGFSRSVFPAISGYIVIEFGWLRFFIFSIILSVPSLILLIKIGNLMKRKYYQL